MVRDKEGSGVGGGVGGLVCLEGEEVKIKGSAATENWDSSEDGGGEKN